MSLFDLSSDEEDLSKNESENSESEEFGLPPPPLSSRSGDGMLEGGAPSVLVGSRLGGGAVLPYTPSTKSENNATRERKGEIGGSVFGKSIASALEQRRREREDRAYARLQQRRLEEQQQPELAEKDKEVGVFITSSYRDLLRRRHAGGQTAQGTRPEESLVKGAGLTSSKEEEDPLESFIQSLEREQVESNVVGSEESSMKSPSVGREEPVTLVTKGTKNGEKLEEVPESVIDGCAPDRSYGELSEKSAGAIESANRVHPVSIGGAAERHIKDNRNEVSDRLCRKLLSVASLQLISERCETL